MNLLIPGFFESCLVKRLTLFWNQPSWFCLDDNTKPSDVVHTFSDAFTWEIILKLLLLLY